MSNVTVPNQLSTASHDNPSTASVVKLDHEVTIDGKRFILVLSPNGNVMRFEVEES